MNLKYNKLITKFDNFYYEDHIKELLEHVAEIRRRNDGVITLKVKYKDAVKELKNFKPAIDKKRLLHVCKELTSSTEALKIEVVFKLPDPDKYYKGDKIEEVTNISDPVFYRLDGSVANLVNLYYNETIFLVLNGPSLNDINLGLLNLPGIISFGINNGAHIFRPTLWTAVDAPHRFMPSIWSDPKITKLIPVSNKDKKLWDIENETFIDKTPADCNNIFMYKRNETFEAHEFLSQSTVNWGNHKDRGGGRSVMVAALKLIYSLGFRRVYLLGCDFTMSKDKKYFFEQDRTKQAIKNNNNSYEIMRGYFERLLPYFEAADFKVYNTYKDSGLKVFPYKSFHEAIDENIIDLSANTEGMYTKRSEDEDANR